MRGTPSRTPTKHLQALAPNMERVPVEIWQQILLKAVETGEGPIFMTSCTSYTFLYFVNQQTRIDNRRHQRQYLDYLEWRQRLRLVCRAWSEFVLLSRHRWLQLDEGSPMYDLDSTTSGVGGVRPVERLSMTIRSEGVVVPILSWTSHILQRPADQSPLRAYALHLLITPRGYNPFDYLVGPTPELHEYTNTALQSLLIRIEFGSTLYIPFPQISSTFTRLRSLFLMDGMTAAPQQTIALPQLEMLYMYQLMSHGLPGPAWDTPALRHAYLGQFRTAAQFTAVLDGFLRRYASRVESLVLLEQSSGATASVLNPPANFWDTFPALRLFGVTVATLERKYWAGWTVVPPTTHPLRYLVCRSTSGAEATVNTVRPRWTYHEGVKFVVGQYGTDTFHLVNSVRDEQWIAKMERTCGILPEL